MKQAEGQETQNRKARGMFEQSLTSYFALKPLSRSPGGSAAVGELNGADEMSVEGFPPPSELRERPHQSSSVSLLMDWLCS